MNITETADSDGNPRYVLAGSWHTGNIADDIAGVELKAISDWLFGEMECHGTLEDDTGNGYACSDIQDHIR
tara:strand:- start:53 stop:265 length:213 start_codon:yes stop_codon:yes gene_type:complete